MESPLWHWTRRHSSWQNVKRTKCQVDKMSIGYNVKLTKFQVDIMSSWQNVKWTKCQDDKMSRGYDFKLTKCQVDITSSWKMSGWQNVKLTKCLYYNKLFQVNQVYDWWPECWMQNTQTFIQKVFTKFPKIPSCKAWAQKPSGLIKMCGEAWALYRGEARFE